MEQLSPQTAGEASFVFRSYFFYDIRETSDGFLIRVFRYGNGFFLLRRFKWALGEFKRIRIQQGLVGVASGLLIRGRL